MKCDAMVEYLGGRSPSIFFGALALIAASAASDAASDGSENPWSSAFPTSTDPVLRLTTANFESTVFHSGRNGMVKFYQSWCGHCKRFKPTWDQLAREVHPSVFIANVDCGASAENEICRSSGITTYPTLRYYLDGTEHDYTGPMSLEGLHEFVGSTLVVPCNPLIDATTCSERAKKYADKWMAKDKSKVLAEVERLGRMMEDAGASTATDLRRWMRERRDILKILQEEKVAKKESGKAGNSNEL